MVISDSQAQKQNQSKSPDQKEKVLLDEIEDFINQMQLSVEDLILKQLYPEYFYNCIRTKYLGGDP